MKKSATTTVNRNARCSYPNIMKCLLAIVLAALASTSTAEEATSVMCDGSGAATAPVVQSPPNKSTAARKIRPPKGKVPKEAPHAASKPAAGEQQQRLKDSKLSAPGIKQIEGDWQT